MTTSERRFGRGRIDLATLSDAELERELQLRRAKRGMLPVGGAQTSSGHGAGAQGAVGHEREQRARHYASLELPEGAPPAEIERAYARLHAKYAPYTKTRIPERRAAAEHLLRALLHARDALLLASISS